MKKGFCFLFDKMFSVNVFGIYCVPAVSFSLLMIILITIYILIILLLMKSTTCNVALIMTGSNGMTSLVLKMKIATIIMIMIGMVICVRLINN